MSFVGHMLGYKIELGRMLGCLLHLVELEIWVGTEIWFGWAGDLVGLAICIIGDLVGEIWLDKADLF